MSSTKTWAANKGTTTRVQTDGSPRQGAGNCKRLYVGRYGTYDYDGYLSFTLDWTGVGKIVSAILTLYTDDGLGILGDTLGSSGTPYFMVRRLTSAFSEGTASETFVTGDWTAPASTTSGGRAPTASRGALEAVNIDVTAFAEAWAPSTVKTRSGAPGGRAANYGVALFGRTDTAYNYACISEDAEPALAAYKPVITLTYEVGPTTPDTPTNLNPSGAVASVASFQGDFTDPRATDLLAYSNVQVYDAGASATISLADVVTSAGHNLQNGDVIYFTSLTGGVGLSTFTAYYVRSRTATTFKCATTNSDTTIVNVTDAYEAATWSKRLYDVTLPESETAIQTGRFDHVPDNLHLNVGVDYRWRCRVKDNEGQWSAWTSLTTFSVTNTNPTAPVLSPLDASSYGSLDGVQFAAMFVDPDVGDTLLAYQVQLSAYPQGDAHWLDDEFILWNTGKRYVSSNATEWMTTYGGQALNTGVYYWRARHWDNHHGVSDWSYASIELLADFIVEPQDSTNAIQLRPRAPWRIVIRDMGTSRGPGDVVAILEDAHNVGASLLYNSPGEAHWTLGKSHPQLSVIEPRQTHYAIEFRQGDGWREVFAGLVWDFDASDADIVFYGVDYLALLDALVDEKYDPANPEKAYNKGGSKYSNVTIRNIVIDQLNRARTMTNSPVGFITVGSIATMSATLTVYSTYQPVLNFIVGLLDSHRAGAGKMTRISVQKTTAGGYQFVVQDAPGVARDNLRLRYGELVQGYRVIPFGNEWATRISAIGRDKDGIKVRYSSVKAPGIDEAIWGRFMRPVFMDGMNDANDLTRRTTQAAVAASMLGKQVALGLRSGFLQPRDGYDLLDKFPVDIEDGSVSTAAFGHDGYWVAVGITWTALQRGDLNTTLTLRPMESGSAPSSDLLLNAPISPQAEWQIGWSDPNPLAATSRYWLDQTTGTVYERTDGDIIATGITGDV